ncbi:MAG: MoaD/ThiS family protein [Euryarchaeota archaeon]|nr:MoaD/ThiS family protein [Euryarchaeota archaeon]
MALVRLSTPLRVHCGGKPELRAEGSTLREVISFIDRESPGFGDRVLKDGRINEFINIFVNNEDVRFLDGLETPVGPGDTISILPAVSGG